MKTNLLFMPALNFFGSASAQSVKLTDKKGNDITNSIIKVYGDTAARMDEFFFIVNTGGVSEQLMIRRREDSILPRTSNYFCLNVSYPPGVSISLTPVHTAPGYTCKTFSVHHSSCTHLGTSSITYIIYINSQDPVSLQVQFITQPLGKVSSAINSSSISEAYHNPSGNYVSFLVRSLVTGELSTEVYNSTGKLQDISYFLTGQELRLNTSNVSKGVYYCFFSKDQRLIGSRKFVPAK